jgi:hypothetical protein
MFFELNGKTTRSGRGDTSATYELPAKAGLGVRGCLTISQSCRCRAFSLVSLDGMPVHPNNGQVVHGPASRHVYTGGRPVHSAAVGLLTA